MGTESLSVSTPTHTGLAFTGRITILPMVVTIIGACFTPKCRSPTLASLHWFLTLAARLCFKAGFLGYQAQRPLAACWIKQLYYEFPDSEDQLVVNPLCTPSYRDLLSSPCGHCRFKRSLILCRPFAAVLALIPSSGLP